MKPNEPCICGSGKAFGSCCEPFLTFQDKPRTVKQLLRSRYAAYALGGMQKYLLKTWHPSTARTISIADLRNDYQWKGLEILEIQQKGDFGLAEFKVTYSEGDGPDQIHHERSVFHRLNGAWLYLEGELCDAGEAANDTVSE